jgi:hypothetical protein
MTPLPLATPALIAAHLVRICTVRPTPEGAPLAERLADDDGLSPLIALVVGSVACFTGPRSGPALEVMHEIERRARTEIEMRLVEFRAALLTTPPPPVEMGLPILFVPSDRARDALTRLSEGEPSLEDVAMMLALVRHRDHLAWQVTELQRGATAWVEATRHVTATLAGVLTARKNADDGANPYRHPSDHSLAEAWKTGHALGVELFTIVCPGCSDLSGADRDVHHLAPACRTDEDSHLDAALEGWRRLPAAERDKALALLGEGPAAALLRATITRRQLRYEADEATLCAAGRAS